MSNEVETEVDRMSQVRPYWPRGLFFDVEDSKQKLLEFKNYTSGASNCLDLGCSATIPYKKFITLHGLNWYGADLMPSTEILEPNYRQVIDSCIPFDNDTFDIICVMSVIEHFTNIEKMFNEIWRCLKPNGILFGQGAFLEMEHDSFFHFTHRGLATILERNKMEVIKIEPTPFSGLIIVAQRFFGGPGVILKDSLELRIKSTIICNLNWVPFIVLNILEYIRKTIFGQWNSQWKDAASFWFVARKNS